MLPETKHALLLQGPNGPFFRRLARDLDARGARVTQVNFNPGDSLFFRGGWDNCNVICYRGTLADWPDTFRELVIREKVDAVFLFGDCKPIHACLRELCEELELPVYVFEEGYIRPDFITLERGGVNGNSGLPKDPDFYRRVAGSIPPLPAPRRVGPTFKHAALWACLNGWSNSLFGWRYPNYTHHRDIRSVAQGAMWIRGGARKWYHRLRERNVTAELSGEWSGRYFFVPLQVHCDSQVQHSDFDSVEAFIRGIAAEFARSAPPDTRLVYKHHPHDRAYSDYGSLMRELAAVHGLGDRIVYVHDLHLPTILRHARATIAMNSTVGLMSLTYGTPVKALGNAIYNFDELTHQGPLADFLEDPGEVDTELLEAFCSYVRATTQINGAFQRRLPDSASHTGLVLDPAPVLDVENEVPEPIGSGSQTARAANSGELD